MKLDTATISGQLYLTGKWLAWDLENTALGNAQARDPRNYVICTAWRNSAGESGLFYGDLLENAEFNKQLNAADFLIAHGGKHEASWLLRAGIDPKRFVWADTLLFEWVLLGNNPNMLKLGLDPVSYRHGFPVRKDPRVQTMFDAGIDTSLIPLDLLTARCQLDVDMTVHTFLKQRELLASSKRLAPAATACLLMPVLSCMEGVGITIGKQDVIDEHTEAEKLAFQMTAEMRELVGGEFNEASPNEMIPLVYGLYPAGVKDEDKTIKTLGFKEPVDHKGNVERGKPTKSWPEGRPVLNKSVLELLEKQAKTPSQKRWVELRRALSKQRALLSKNLDFFLGVVKERDCKFYAQLMQGITATHRLSSLGLPVKFDMFESDKSVQVQNVPRSLKYLQQSPDPDYLMFDVDGMQLEFRVAAFCGNDDVAKADILNPDFDAHLQTLTCMLNKGKFDSKLYADLLAKYRAGDKKVALDRADNVLCKSHCWSMDTKVLTPQGWKGYGELRVGDAVINYDQCRNVLMLDCVRDITAAHERSDMLCLSTKHNWATTVTADHRMYGWTRRDRGNKGRVWEADIVRADAVHPEFRICTSAVYNGPVDIDPDDAARIGWLCTDGLLKVLPKHGLRAIVIQKKPEGLQAINALFPTTFRREVRPDGTNYVFLPAQYAYALCIRVGIDPAKPDWQSFIIGLSTTARRAWLHAVCLADGTRRSGGEWRIGQLCGPLANAMRLAAFLCGYDVRVVYATIQTGKRYEFITLRTRPYVNGTRIRKEQLPKQNAWCITTHNHTAVIKQGDTMMVTGQTFKPLFGGRSGTKVQVGYYDFFNEKYKGIAQTQARWLAEVERGRPIVTPTGMQFSFNVQDRYGKCFDVLRDRPVKPSAYNYPIQYFAGGELIPISIVHLVHAAQASTIRVVFTNTVHDSITGYVHKDDVQAFVKLVGECFTDRVAKHLYEAYGLRYDVPLGVEIKVGPKLGEGDKFVCSKRVIL